jgi:hypothetical protein
MGPAQREGGGAVRNGNERRRDDRHQAELDSDSNFSSGSASMADSDLAALVTSGSEDFDVEYKAWMKVVPQHHPNSTRSTTTEPMPLA